MSYLNKILLAILISSPVSVYILLITEFFTDPEFFSPDNYGFNLSIFWFYPLIFGLIYLILGLPTTLINDVLLKICRISSRKYKLILSFITYSIVGVVFMICLDLPLNELVSYATILTPVYIYLIVVNLIRRELLLN